MENKEKPSPHVPQHVENFVNHYNGLTYTFRTWLYDCMIFILNTLFIIFFREIKVRGGHNVPPVGTPTILVCAPHANQFIDPSLVMVTTRKMLYDGDTLNAKRARQTCFVTAASSFKTPVVAQFGIATGGIPVPRPQDNLVSVDNRIMIFAPDLENNPTLIKGRVIDDSLPNPGFTKSFVAKSLLGLPNFLGNAKIETVVDDSTIILSAPFKSLDSKVKEKIDNILTKGTNFKYAEKVDNSKVFQSVFNNLKTKGCVGIFPEGGSHDRPSLLPIKAGVAIMALGAAAADPTLKVSIVPCGLSYFHRQRFRSRAVIEYGEPIIVDSEMGREYEKDPRGSVSKLLKKVTDSLYAVTENAPDYETLMAIQAARRLYKPVRNNKNLSLSAVCQINRNLLLGYSKFKDDPRIVNLKSSVQTYNRQLFSLGLKDHHVMELKTGPLNILRTFMTLVRRLLQIVVYFALSFPGYILFTPIFFTASYYSKKKQIAGLKKSVVKIKGIDLIATWKLIVALGMAPIMYITYSLTLVYLHKHNYNIISWLWVPSNYSCIQYCYFYALLVLTTYSSLKTGEVGMDLLKSLSPLVFTLLNPGEQIKELQKVRTELSTNITQVCNELGPEVLPNFEKYKTIDTDSVAKSISSSTRSRSSSLSSFVSNSLSRVNSRGSLTDVPIFSDGINGSCEESISSESEGEPEAQGNSKIADMIRERRKHEKGE